MFGCACWNQCRSVSLALVLLHVLRDLRGFLSLRICFWAFRLVKQHSLRKSDGPDMGLEASPLPHCSNMPSVISVTLCFFIFSLWCLSVLLLRVSVFVWRMCLRKALLFNLPWFHWWWIGVCGVHCTALLSSPSHRWVTPITKVLTVMSPMSKRNTTQKETQQTNTLESTWWSCLYLPGPSSGLDSCMYLVGTITAP